MSTPMRAARTQTSTQATPSIATLPAAARTAAPARALTPAPPALRLGIAPAAGRGARAEGVAQLVSSPGGGDPLPAQVREALETGLGADLKAVRVHTDARAEAAAAALPARAFTYGTHIFLGAGARPTDLGLMAHEAAHVVQQGGAPVLQKAAEGEGDAYEHEAQEAGEALARGGRFNVRSRTGGARVQSLGLSDILDTLADLAANIPGYTLLTVILGRNPINLRTVERSFTNILRAFMGLIPGGEILFQVLNRYGVVARLGTWVSNQVDALGITYSYIRGRFTAFTDSLGWRDIFHPSAVWRRARDIFTEPITRIRNFVSRLISQAITWLKETFMQPLSNFCRQIPGYTLVTVLLGRDPFTGAAVARTALNVVRAFAEFIPGGTEKVNQLVESRALQRAYEWFTQETQARNLTWARVSGTFAQVWAGLRLEDVLHPIDTLQRIVNQFRPLMSDLVGFAGAALMKLLELIFEAVMGSGGARVLAILKRARATFLIVIRNPVGFLRNLLRAVGQGIGQFRTNILRHLREGVIAWLTGPVARAGIQMPERWDARGIIWFVLQILGLTWDRVRQKLVNLLGERTVAMLEAGFQLIQDIRQRGFVQALRDRVTEFFGQLREAALGSIRNFIQQRLVMAGITQLVSMLNPVGAVIQAIIKTYTTVNFFIQKINQILDLVESIVNSVAAIAAGAVGQAANFIETTMARTIPVILDFLARFIGLGDVGAHVQRTIQALQTRVDQMLDRAVEWIRTMAQRLVAAGREAVSGLVDWWRGARKPFRTRDNQTHSIFFEQSGSAITLMVASEKKQVATFFTDKERELSAADPPPADKPAKLAALIAARNLYTSQINPLRDQIDAVNNSRDSATVKQGRLRPLQTRLDPLLQQLADQLVILGVGTNDVEVVPTQIQPNGVAGSPKSMVADPLTKHGEPGSRPSADPPGWKEHIETIPNFEDYYVRLHLLSERLHGKGVAGNLTPGRKSENTLMEGNAESPAARLVEGGHVLWYESSVTRYRTTTYPGDTNTYQYFAEAIIIRYGFKEKTSPTQWVRRAPSFEQRFPIAEPDQKGTRDPIPTLDTMSMTWINRNATLAGLPRNAMNRIIAGRQRRLGGAYGTMRNFMDSDEVKAEVASDSQLLNKINNAIRLNKLKGLP